MYTVMMDNLTIHDPSYNDATHILMDGVVNKQVNKADSFSFTIYPENVGYQALDLLSSWISVYKDGALIFHGRPLTEETVWDNAKHVVCEGDLAILNDTVCRPYSFSGTLGDYVRMLVNQHNAQVGSDKQITVRTVDNASTAIVRRTGEYKSTMQELFEKTVNYFGGYIVIGVENGTRYLDYLVDSTAGTNQVLEIGKNILDFQRSLSSEALATALIPLGATDDESGERLTIKSVNAGNDYIVSSDAATRGLIYACYTWDSITDATELLNNARALLTDLVRISPRIELSAVDLSDAGYDIDAIGFFEYVTVQDTTHAVSGQYLITERTYNISAPEKDTVTFGSEEKTISGQTAKAQADLSQMTDALINKAVEIAAYQTDLLKGGSGGYFVIGTDQDGHPSEIYFMDTDSTQTARSVLRINRNGIGFSTTGFAGPYTNAWTIDGHLNADFITAGQMSADRVDLTGVLTVGNMTAETAANLVTGTTVKDQYYISTSSASATGGSWSDTAVAWSTGKYVWTRVATTKTYADGHSTTTYSTAVYDANLTTSLSTGASAASTASSAASAASAAQTTANGANARDQLIYISKASGTSSVSANTTWVTNADGAQNKWGTKRPVYNSSYPVLFVAMQRQTVAQMANSGTTCSCTTPVKDDTTTVIDGGHITTGTIDASVATITNINASNITSGTIAAARIAAGSLAIEKLDTDAQNTINTASTNAAEALQRGVEYIVGTQTASTNAWTGVTTDSAIYTGKTIAYYLPYAGTSSAATLNLTLSGGGTTGAKNVRINNSNVTTHYPAGTIINLTFDGTYWKADNYDSNNYDRTRYNSNVYALAAITAGHLMAGTASGYKQLAASLAFDLSYPILYCGTAIAEAANGTNNYTMMSGVNFSTTGTIQGGAAKKVLYLKGTVSGTTFTIAASNWLTTTVPSSADSAYYIPLGVMSSATNGSFLSSNQLWGFVNGSFQTVSTGAQGIADAAKTAAATAQTTANGALASTVSCYYRSTTSTTPTISTSTSIGTAVDTSNAWEYILPRPKSGCYFFTCERYTTKGGTVSFSTVRQIANATYTSLWCSSADATYIDGGHIYASSVTADKIKANETFTQKLYATDFNITGGSVNISTSADTEDTIILDGANTKVYIGTYGYFVYNKSSASLPNYHTSFNAAAWVLKDDSSNTTPVRIQMDSSRNPQMFFSSASGGYSALMWPDSAGAGRFVLGDGTSTLWRTELTNSGLVFRNSSDAQTAKYPNSLTASRALVTGTSGLVSVSSTTSTELGYVHGVTSAIQTQLNAKAPKPTLATSSATAVSVAHQTYKSVGSISLAAGTWLVKATIAFAANATGTRYVVPSYTANSSSTAVDWSAEALCPAVPRSGFKTNVQTVFMVTHTETKAIYFNAWQDSGSALSTQLLYQTIKLA